MLDFELEEHINKIKRLEYRRTRVKRTMLGSIAFAFLCTILFSILLGTNFLGKGFSLFHFIYCIFIIVADIIFLITSIYRLKRIDVEIEELKTTMDTIVVSKKDISKKSEIFTDVFEEDVSSNQVVFENEKAMFEESSSKKQEEIFEEDDNEKF